MPQSVLLANKILLKQLKKRGYHQISPKDLETQMATIKIHTGGGLFWREICGGKACTPPQVNTRGKLHSHDRVGWHKIHWNYTILGLNAKTSASITTRVYQEISQIVQPHKNKTKKTVPKRPYQIRKPKNKMPRNHHQRQFLKKGDKFIQ